MLVLLMIDQALPGQRKVPDLKILESEIRAVHLPHVLGPNALLACRTKSHKTGRVSMAKHVLTL